MLSQWQKLGIEFGVKPAERTADIERLLVDSAELLVVHQKLLVPVASWLCRYYRIVCKHRLAKTIKDISCPETIDVLKSLFSFVKQEASTEHFNLAIKACGDFENAVANLLRHCSLQVLVVKRLGFRRHYKNAPGGRCLVWF
jgi:hypothetical protein